MRSIRPVSRGLNFLTEIACSVRRILGGYLKYPPLNFVTEIANTLEGGYLGIIAILIFLRKNYYML